MSYTDSQIYKARREITRRREARATMHAALCDLQDARCAAGLSTCKHDPERRAEFEAAREKETTLRAAKDKNEAAIERRSACAYAITKHEARNGFNAFSDQ